MPREQHGTKTAKMLYRPVGLVGSIAAGALSSFLVGQVWKRATAGDNADPPQALQSEYRLRQVLVAAAVQGAIFATVKALADRGGARAFQRWTGEWPGD
ncbi:DUF4235 domain-containing protein [Terracoccus luteus]|jgi:hypothetical protein|uniref:Uncharacterized protein DUF4235 n=1 Tax=Terracoccus luteus TaxID=53356 RepID=A0A495XVH7_9MICO|nr:DUF4235 domain-containing protein [Terracoccus luteus]MBB2985222.1 hypothetical protein [Terracoccus luteus]MCP2170874.1 hypothetical protein [Terracoccus luteus]RKT77519.1 uncharacterized protein DUF4235 [Terracoccus luteus]